MQSLAKLDCFIRLFVELSIITIISQSYQKDPQKLEFFQETVGDKYYEIIGFDYYSNDDASMSPPLWFYGKYERQ